MFFLPLFIKCGFFKVVAHRKVTFLAKISHINGNLCLCCPSSSAFGFIVDFDVSTVDSSPSFSSFSSVLKKD